MWHAWVVMEHRHGYVREARTLLAEALRRAPQAKELHDLDKQINKNAIDVAIRIQELLEHKELAEAERLLKDALFLAPLERSLLALRDQLLSTKAVKPS